jgi:hypothetical protein
MESQPWNIQTGRWRITIGLAFVSVLAFAGFYYPYIKPSWGGGAASPATIYFTKDSPILPGRNVSAKIIDETDSGFLRNRRRRQESHVHPTKRSGDAVLRG